LILRVHPSAFLELWEEILRLSKVQKPSATVEDLRYEIGSIEVMGPNSTEALIGTLHPIESSQKKPVTPTAEKVWQSLTYLQNPSLLPKHAVLSFETSDPRLHNRIKLDQPTGQEYEDLVPIIAKWPLDRTPGPISLFDREKRRQASQSLASQKSMSRRKTRLSHSESLQPLATDPKIPVLLFTQQYGRGHQGSWTLLLPWKIVSTIWYALMHYQLSCGDTPRFGGLVQHRQVMYEAGFPWFPADFPGTAAGMQWEQLERVKAKAEWEKCPKGRRPEFNSLDLGNGRKGEVGMGWACDWERLMKGPGISGENQIIHPLGSEANNIEATEESHKLSQLPLDHGSVVLQDPSKVISGNALLGVRIIMLTKGVPGVRARIYRIPTGGESQQKKWLALMPTGRKKVRYHQFSCAY
jgi:ribonuclease P/MRP protein subunit POP1